MGTGAEAQTLSSWRQGRSRCARTIAGIVDEASVPARAKGQATGDTSRSTSIGEHLQGGRIRLPRAVARRLARYGQRRRRRRSGLSEDDGYPRKGSRS